MERKLVETFHCERCGNKSDSINYVWDIDCIYSACNPYEPKTEITLKAKVCDFCYGVLTKK